MNKLKELSKKKWFIVLVIVLAIALVGGLGTYAMFYWRSAQNTEITLKIGDIADVTFPDGQELNTNSLAPVFNYTDGETLSFSIQNKDTTGATIKYTVNFNITNIDEQLRTTQLKYKLISGNTTLGEGDFSTATNNSTIKLAEGNLPTGTSNYTFYIYIDSNEENNPNMMNRNIRGVVEVTAVEKGELMSEYITNLYLNNKDTRVTNNTIEYQYATSENLMNDRLGGTTDDLDGGNIRYYGSDPNNYIDINDIIFDGMKEKGNWENAFGEGTFQNSEDCREQLPQLLEQYYAYCTEEYFDYVKDDLGITTIEECRPAINNMLGIESIEQTCTSHEEHVRDVKLWRIIGVFDGKIRVIKNSDIGYYMWDTTSDGVGINEWSQADIMKLLNPEYEDNQDEIAVWDDNTSGYISQTGLVNNSLWWNKQDGKCYSRDTGNGVGSLPAKIGVNDCYYSNNDQGLSEEAKPFIDNQTVYLGGFDTYEATMDLYANQIYATERGTNVIQNPSDGITRTTVWTGKVALPYLSDVAYSVDLNNCTGNYLTYNNCASSWLSESSMWTVNPNNRNKNLVISSIYRYQGINTRGRALEAYENQYIYPVLTLNANVERLSGTGTYEDPYRIK